LETIIAKGILRGDFKEGDTIFVEVQNEHLAFSRLPATILMQET
jgi:ATP-dependent Clp protease ATP-binding subunit ClpB